MKLLNNTYKNIAWITCLDSWVSWKTLALFCLTHGNEPAGLKALEYLFYDYKLAEKLKQGRVLLCVVNLEAYEKYKSSTDKNVWRFVDINMNRIGQFLDNKESSEYKRFQELLPLFDEIDVVLDIHSTDKQQGSSMGICDRKHQDVAYNILDVERILAHPYFDEEGALISFITRQGKVGFGIECGSHQSPRAYKNAVRNCLNILSYYGLVDQKLVLEKRRERFTFLKEIFPKTKKFAYTREWDNFDEVLPGEIFATDGDMLYKNDTDDVVYIWIIWQKVRVWDGICYLFKK